jgi:sulfur-oxidizing protein SoxA
MISLGLRGSLCCRLSRILIQRDSFKWHALMAVFLTCVFSCSQAQTVHSLPTAKPQDARLSGFEFMGESTRALQLDASQNPAMLSVREGEQLWSARIGSKQAACQDCHGNANESMRGIASRYPAWDGAIKRPVSLSHRINLCRSRYLGMDQSLIEGPATLALEAYLALQSKADRITSVDDPNVLPWLENGHRLFEKRIGQIALSCADCHEHRAGSRLGASVIPQAHPTAYPVYRLQWQSLGALSRRIRGCFSGIRAELPEPYSDPMVSLELYLRQRAAGMPHEGPGVRP